MSPAAENMLERMKSAGLPVPAPPNPGLEELVELGLVSVYDFEEKTAYPDDYRVWTLTEAGK